MLLATQNTLTAVRNQRIMSRQIQLTQTDMPQQLQQDVDAFLVAIGGIRQQAKGVTTYLFKCHPHVAIGRALLNGTITIEPAQ